MLDLKRMKKECFWDYDFSDKEILDLAKSDNRHEKSFLFQKILLNSTKLFKDLKIFDKEDIVWLIEDYQVPSFNYEYAFKRKNLAEVYFLNKPLLIDELKWIE